jgi:hypothetical protein
MMLVRIPHGDVAENFFIARSMERIFPNVGGSKYEGARSIASQAP